MNIFVQILSSMIVMAIVDLPMIRFVIQPTLEKTAKEYIAVRPDILAALIFYVMYVSIVVWMTKDLDSLQAVAGRGALLGLLAYGTYEFTNKAVLAKWSWQMVAVDVTWGIVLTSIVACTAYLVRSF